MRALLQRLSQQLVCLSLGTLLALACVSASEPAASPQELPPVQRVEDPSKFSADRAWAHLTALTEIGPRVSGSEGAERARQYIAAELAADGIEVMPEPEGEPLAGVPSETRVEPRNVLAVVPGESDDLIVLAAPYDSRMVASFPFLGANDGASGAALLLELAGVIAARPLPYTIWFLFLDAEAPLGEGPHETMGTQLFGSRLQALRFRAEGVIPRIRLLVAFNRICDADLTIARDIGSHRPYREGFWNAAARLGHDDVFPGGQGFETLAGSHQPFFGMGLRRIVFISDSAFGGDEAPGLYALLEELRLAVDAPEIEEIYLVQDCNAGVLIVPRIALTPYGRSYLIVGLPLLMGLSTGELRTILSPIGIEQGPAPGRLVEHAGRVHGAG